MSSVKVSGQVIVGKFSKTEGSKVRTMYTETGKFLGFIEKLEEGGYRILRLDGKQREKEKLEDAYRSIARQN